MLVLWRRGGHGEIEERFLVAGDAKEETRRRRSLGMTKDMVRDSDEGKKVGLA
jgi:hypothetical protein